MFIGFGLFYLLVKLFVGESYTSSKHGIAGSRRENENRNMSLAMALMLRFNQIHLPLGHLIYLILCDVHNYWSLLFIGKVVCRRKLHIQEANHQS